MIISPYKKLLYQFPGYTRRTATSYNIIVLILNGYIIIFIKLAVRVYLIYIYLKNKSRGRLAYLSTDNVFYYTIATKEGTDIQLDKRALTMCKLYYRSKRHRKIIINISQNN